MNDNFTTPQFSLNAVDFAAMEEGIRNSYRGVASQYRRDDEIEITSEAYQHLNEILSRLSAGFGRPITVLDAGCGTGRYFHCLKRVKKLVGMDVSKEMLELALHPVRQEGMSIGEIELRCENVHFSSFPPQLFDFIYSLGMFGNACPVTVELCNRFYEWLAPDGKLFFNAVSMESKTLPQRLKRKIRGVVYPVLPRCLKNMLDGREARAPFFGLTKKELIAIMRESRFTDFSISSYTSHSRLWRGVHLECQAVKT